MLASRRVLHPAPVGLAAKHISNHDCWRHFEKSKPRNVIMCGLLARFLSSSLQLGCPFRNSAIWVDSASFHCLHFGLLGISISRRKGTVGFPSSVCIACANGCNKPCKQSVSQGSFAFSPGQSIKFTPASGIMHMSPPTPTIIGKSSPPQTRAHCCCYRKYTPGMQCVPITSCTR